MISTVDCAWIPPHVTLAAALGLGLMSSVNVCAVVRLPILTAYVAGAGISRKHALVLTGLLTLGLAAGTVLVGLTAIPLADGVHRTLQVNKLLFWVLGSCLVVAGVLISGLVNPQLVPERWRRSVERLVKTEGLAALLLGLALGLLQMPACPTCRAQLLIVADSAGAGGGSLYGLILLAGFAAGQSVVLLGVGALTGLLWPSLFVWLRRWICSIEPRMQLLIGNMLVVIGIYFVAVG
jgi:cytochrome c biogenesis protein CcdA